MNIGKATSIFKNITSDKFTVTEKIQAIREVLNMPTHNSISKEQILFALDWLWSKHCKIEIEIVTEAAHEHKKCGVWYPVSDPPEADIYGLAFSVSGKRGNTEYHHGLMLNNCNCYEEGKFLPGGIIDNDLTVEAWLEIPVCPIDITASK